MNYLDPPLRREPKLELAGAAANEALLCPFLCSQHQARSLPLLAPAIAYPSEHQLFAFHSLPFFCLKNKYHTWFSWADLGFGIGHKSRHVYEVRERKGRKWPGVQHLHKDAVYPTSKIGGKVLHREPVLPK